MSSQYKTWRPRGDEAEPASNAVFATEEFHNAFEAAEGFAASQLGDGCWNGEGALRIRVQHETSGILWDFDVRQKLEPVFSVEGVRRPRSSRGFG